MVAPRPLALLLCPTLLSLACSTAEAPFEARLNADGLSRVEARVDQGDLRYSGDMPTILTVEGRSWGQAADEAVAQERLASVWWSAEREGPAAVLAVGASAPNAGADLAVQGPRQVDLHLRLWDGEIEVAGVAGQHQLEASSVRLSDVQGSAWIRAGAGGVDADLWPGPRDQIHVESQGSVHLRLPLGPAYDLQVWGDPAHSLVVSDLGFHSVVAADGYFAGTAGPGSVRIDVIAHGGDVIIEPAWSW